jgi:hypothetical protein
MFSDELAVRYGKSSYFVPKSTVRETNDREGRLKVRVFRKNQRMWAVLPTDDQAIIPIEKEDLVLA